MINRHSILFKINTVFIVVSIIVTIAFAIFFDIFTKKSQKDIEHYCIETYHKIIHDYKFVDKQSLEAFFNYNNIEVITNNAIVLKNGTKLQKGFGPPENKIFGNEHPPPPPHIKEFEQDVQIYLYKSSIFININSASRNIMFKLNNIQFGKEVFYLKIIYISFLLILGILYFLIRQNLGGLKILKKSIKEYEKGLFDYNQKIENKDEISLILKEFCIMTKKIDTVEKSRKLFLRNIMHELKTPLTKSKLYSQLLEDSNTKDKLENSLNRLEVMINEIAQIEQISSKDLNLDIKNYRLLDIIDQAVDIMMIQKDIIDIKGVDEVSLDVDFKLFSVVIKNLLDNGIKYSTNKKVSLEYKENSILVSSKGEKLKFNFDRYLEPFFKGDLNSINQKGFGLGLYIVSEILKKHAFKFDYIYEEESNIFIIKL
jgi:two-component system OmpR family sensor kinase